MNKKLLFCIISACLVCGATIAAFMSKSNIFDGNIEALSQGTDTQSSTKIPNTNTYQYYVDWKNNSDFQNFLEAVQPYATYVELGAAFAGDVIGIALAAFSVVKNFADALNPKEMYINCCGPNGLACDPDGEYLAKYKDDCIYFKKGIYAN